LHSVIRTQIGGSILEALENRKDGDGKVKAFQITLHDGASGSDVGANWIDLNRDRETLQHESGQRQASWERLLAHEFGHAALGIYDTGSDMMENVRRVENPIMQELGDRDNRTSYETPGFLNTLGKMFGYD
jgi:hypothetical protein